MTTTTAILDRVVAHGGLIDRDRASGCYRWNDGLIREVVGRSLPAADAHRRQQDLSDALPAEGSPLQAARQALHAVDSSLAGALWTAVDGINHALARLADWPERLAS